MLGHYMGYLDVAALSSFRFLIIFICIFCVKSILWLIQVSMDYLVLIRTLTHETTEHIQKCI